MNRKMTTGVSELHPVPVKAPWHMLGIDFIGPLTPEAEDGSQYILTISDYFTKWVEAIPTPDKTASTVADSLFKVFIINDFGMCTFSSCLGGWVHMYMHMYCYFGMPMQLFMRMGVPQVIVSDQGREFNNALNDDIAKQRGIRRRLTTPYHPQVRVYTAIQWTSVNRTFQVSKCGLCV